MHGLGVEPTPRSPRRSTSAWSPTPAASCTRTPAPRAHLMAAELIEAGVDVHGDLPPALRGHAAGEARAARPRARRRSQRFDDGALTLAALSARGLRRAPAPRTATPRAIIDHLRARAAARRSRRSCASSRAASAGGAAQSLAARDRRRRRRLGDRPRPGRRRPPPRRRLLDDARASTSSSRSCAGRSPRSCLSVRGRADVTAAIDERSRMDGVLLSTSRRDRPRTTSSRAVRARARRRRKVGHAGTLDPFATGLLIVLVGRATRVAALR